MKLPLFISPLVDRPGMLFDILRTFNERRINLTAIISRPTKKIMGTYHFYMEIDAYSEDFDVIMEAAKLIAAKYNLKIMGAYLVYPLPLQENEAVFLYCLCEEVCPMVVRLQQC